MLPSCAGRERPTQVEMETEQGAISSTRLEFAGGGAVVLAQYTRLAVYGVLTDGVVHISRHVVAQKIRNRHVVDMSESAMPQLRQWQIKLLPRGEAVWDVSTVLRFRGLYVADRG